jgi:glycosyltransferase involved in cell wall biosynthesis
MPKLWIDLTDLSRWRGSMTGIPRVVYELATRFNANNGTMIGFFVHNEEQHKCYEVTFDNLYDNVSFIKNNKCEVNLIFKLFNKIKNSKIIKKINSRKITHSQVIANLPQHFNATAPFSKNDIIFIMGSTWDCTTKIHDLVSLKHNLDLKYVQIIYDVIPTFHPQLFGPGFASQFDSCMFESIVNADLLLCISEATKQELLKFCTITRIKSPPIKIIRCGEDYTQHSAPVIPKINLVENEPFILCLGTLEGRKNQNLLYYVVKEALYKGIDIPKIVIAGRAGWLVQDLSYILKNDNMLYDKLQYLGEVTDEEKTWLYQNCSFTIYPSVFEGWGLPVAESLYYGKPCLSSSISSMPEIGGNLVDYFSPFDTGECLRKIIEYSKPDVLAKQAEKIKLSYKPFSWDQTFKQVEGYINNL